jgi:hypothetical protein
MVQKPDLDDIDRLHHVGRQLATLKRLYQSYQLIIDRVLEKQKQMQSLISASHHSTANLPQLDREASPDGADPSLSRQQSGSRRTSSNSPSGSIGLTLTPAAIHRFERLRDRVTLYALSEIQECISTADSLVFMVGRCLTGCHDVADTGYTEF